ncbi:MULTISPECIES: hypothetical protein [unclassified Microcoleus]
MPDRTILPHLFEKSAVYEPTWQNLARNWGILGLHASDMQASCYTIALFE